jgi:tetratricopeptide (TPR) repeat protein
MPVSKVALAAMSLLCGGAALVSAPAGAQPAAAPRNLVVGGAEGNALQALQRTLAGPDRAAQDAAIAAARAAVRSAEGRYALGNFLVRIGQARGDARLIGEGVDAAVASGLAGQDEMPALLANQAARAHAAAEYERAERLLTRAIELQPNNAALLADLAQMRSQSALALLRAGGRQAEAQTAYRDSVSLLTRAIAAQKASGQVVPESWYLRAVALAVESRQAPQAIALSRALVEAYPTTVNWRDALLTYRQLGAPDPALDLDIRRLLRAVEGLAGERDYLDFAQALRAANPGEAKAVLDEGVSRRMLDAGEAQVRTALTAVTRPAAGERSGLAASRTRAMAAATGAAARAAADAHFGVGQYAEAAELYRAALQKGGEDANLVNSRLGAALALAGRRAEAEAAFRTVTGPRADLAGFWLAWLSRRPAA